MKRLSQILFVSLVALVSISILTGFTSSDHENTENIEIYLSDNSCTLYVKTSYDSPAKSVKVSTEVSGGISCIGGRDFYTNSDGKVTLKWVSGCNLKKIYVKGKGYDVDYKDGKTYNLTMK